ncbi:MAG TPA: hypothetical protein VMW76_02860 [Bacteroidales bacterium]|nr:hypothetical protein [Bacteroidales bacterium]
MKIYIPPQVTRLLLFLVLFIAIFTVIKRLLTPENFGELGHYRPGSLADNAAYEPNYAGDETCIMCHPDVFESKGMDLHGDISCETCHDAGFRHSESMDATDIHIPAGREFCGICHSQNAGRSANYVFQVDLKGHNTGKNCTDCHNPHQPWDLKE